MTKLEQAHNEFVEHLESQGKSESTIIAYKKDIEQLVDHLYKSGLQHVHEINTDHLKEFMDKMSSSGLTNKTVSRKTNATKTFFRYLKNKNHIQVNVADQLKHPKVKINPPRILSKLEYRALRDTVKDDVRTFAIVEVLLQTGLSISELALMEVEHLEVDYEKEVGSLFIPARESKENRRVPLNKAVVEAIRKYMEDHRPKKDNAKHVFITKTGNPLPCAK